MNLTFLWINILAICFLWAAFFKSVFRRIQTAWLRGVLTVIAVIIPAALLIAFVWLAALLKFSLHIQPNRYAYFLSLLLVYAICILVAFWISAIRKPDPYPRNHMPSVSLAVALLISIATAYLMLAHIDQTVRTRAEITAENLNATILSSRPAISYESQNAQPLYTKAFRMLDEANEDERQIHNPPTGNTNIFDPNEPATVAYLQKHADIIALLHQASTRPACRFDEDLHSLDVEPVISNLSAFRNAASILNLHAHEEVAKGNIRSAIADAQAIFNIGQHIAQRPFFVATLVALGIEALARETLDHALPYVKNANDLAPWHPEPSMSLVHMMQYGLHSDERFALAAWNNVLGLELATTGLHSPLAHHALNPEAILYRVFLLDLDGYTKFMDSQVQFASQPYFAVRDQIHDLFDQNRPRDLLVATLQPGMERALDLVGRCQAIERSADIAVALTRYRLDHGALPQHLDALVPAYLPAIPTDPFDGKPLHLVIRAGDWIIYSVGADGIDDGGAKMDRYKGDLLFTLHSAATASTTEP